MDIILSIAPEGVSDVGCWLAILSCMARIFGVLTCGCIDHSPNLHWDVFGIIGVSW